LIRMYYSREGRTKIVSRFNSYHGSTAASINLTGDFRRVAVDTHTSLPGFVRIPDPYCYRCPFGLKYPECGVACAEYLDYVIRNEGNVGGVVVEPVTVRTVLSCLRRSIYRGSGRSRGSMGSS